MKKKYRLIIILFIILSSAISLSFFVNTQYAFELHLNHFSSSQKSSPIKYQRDCNPEEIHSHLLNDRVHQYLEASYLNGIRSNLKFIREIDPLLKSGKLTPLNNSSSFIIDTLWYSYPFLTPEASKLLNRIGLNFQKKIRNTNLEGTKIVVTSLLRTTSSIKRLRRRNRNAIRYSSHLHGTTFDITYENFRHTTPLSKSELEGLKEILAKTLFDLRANNHCWVTYERAQKCFHIVSR